MGVLTGLRVLVVEDEGVVALLIEDMLQDLGCVVVGSIANLSRALEAARVETFDLAMLDVNLDGQLVFPVAEVLRSRRVPFLFSTGYGRIGVPDMFNDREVLSKPFVKDELERKLLLALDRQ